MFSVRAIVLVLALPVITAGQQPAANRRPNLEGTWNSATATPLERPSSLKDKPFFTEKEAEEFEREVARRNEEPPPTAKRTGTAPSRLPVVE